MDITFFPVLGETTTVRVAPVPSDVLESESQSQAVFFKAAFGSQESFHRAKAEGVTVELWSNLPVAGRPLGEWGATPFTALDLGPSENAPQAQTSFSLLTNEDTEQAKVHDDDLFHLQLRIPLQGQVGSSFQFTYRLVYPSGHIEWLGTYNANGVLAIEQGLPGAHIAREWTGPQNGRYHIDSNPADNVLVRLERSEDWTIWLWPSSGYPKRFVGGDEEDIAARVAVLLPRPISRSLSSRQPLVLAATSSFGVRTEDGGSVSFFFRDVVGQATLAPLRHSKDLLEDSAKCTLFAGGSCFVLATTTLFGPASPFHVVVIPVDAGADGRVLVPLRELHPSISKTSAGGLALYSPTLRRAKIFRDLESSDVDGTLEVGPSGADLVVSPVQIIQDGNASWQVSLLTPCKDISTRVDRAPPNHPLPTPPPSPPVRLPLNAAEPQCPSQQSVESSSSDDSVASTTTDTARYSPEPVRPQRRRSPSLSLVIRTLSMRMVRAYLHAVFNVIFWFWSVFFKSIAVRVLGEGLPRRVSTLLSVALLKTRSNSRKAVGSSRPVPQSEAPELPPPTRSTRRSAEAGVTDPSACTPDRGVASIIAPQPQIPTSRTQELPSSTRVVVSATISCKSRCPSVMLQGGRPLKELRATMDGRRLSIASVVELEDQIHLVELVDLTEGLLEVSFDL